MSPEGADQQERGITLLEVWCGVVWCGVVCVWCGVVWCGVCVWCGGGGLTLRKVLFFSMVFPKARLK